MKSLKYIAILLLCLGTQLSFAQSEEKKEETKTEQPSSDNFMDLGAKTMSDIFGSELDGNPDGKSLNFLQLLEKSELPQEQKAEWKNWYHLQSKNLTQKQKDSLGKALEKKLREAQANPNH